MADGDLLLVTPTFYPEQVGTPHYVTDFVLEARKQELSVRVLTNQPYYPGFKRFEGYGRGTRHDALGDIAIYRLPTVVPRSGGQLWRLLGEANMLLQGLLALALRRVPRTLQVLAVSPGSPAALILGSLARRRGGSMTAVVHDVGFGLARTAGGAVGRLIAGAVRKFEVGALNRADDVTVLSDAMGRTLRLAGVTVPIRTIELWPTIEPEDYGAPPETPTVAYSGNLGRKQGVGRLLDLAQALEELAPEARLLIRGDGSQRRHLQDGASRKRLENVHFLDLVPVDDLAGALAGAHVHVVPQSPEGAGFAVPSKVVNVLAVGRPAVVTASDNSPLGDLARECPAVVRVEPGDIDEFASAVSAILDMDAVEYAELSAAARQWASARDRTTAVQRTIAGI